MKYVRLKQFAKMVGETQEATRSRCKKGVWTEGVEFKRAPNGTLWIDIEAVERWIEGRGSKGA